MDVDVAWMTMLRKLEMVVFQVGQRVAHVAFAGEQLAGIVKRLPFAKDAAAAADVVEGRVGDNSGPMAQTRSFDGAR